jgi:hypothetical protein
MILGLLSSLCYLRSIECGIRMPSSPARVSRVNLDGNALVGWFHRQGHVSISRVTAKATRVKIGYGCPVERVPFCSR